VPGEVHPHVHQVADDLAQQAGVGRSRIPPTGALRQRPPQRERPSPAQRRLHRQHPGDRGGEQHGADQRLHGDGDPQPRAPRDDAAEAEGRRGDDGQADRVEQAPAAGGVQSAAVDEAVGRCGEWPGVQPSALLPGIARGGRRAGPAA
jgi:hypothetical protein